MPRYQMLKFLLTVLVLRSAILALVVLVGKETLKLRSSCGRRYGWEATSRSGIGLRFVTDLSLPELLTSTVLLLLERPRLQFFRIRSVLGVMSPAQKYRGLTVPKMRSDLPIL